MFPDLFADLECVHTGQAEKLLNRSGNQTSEFLLASSLL